ncbi:MAG: hypothetical protein ACRDPI_07380 [Nocardioidaceae bacterium]
MVLGLLDAAFSGFRSSLGRSGLIGHRKSDVLATYRGAVLGAALLAPAVAFFGVDVGLLDSSPSDYRSAGEAALIVFVPYAALTMLALAIYGFLGWRRKYLASAAVLGPFTLVRPLVVAAGALFGILRADDVRVTIAILWSAAAVLGVEAVAGRVWYASAQR